MKGKMVMGIVGLSFFVTMQANAALLYMDPGIADISPGDTLKISVRLDTDEGECINVVDGVINYSANIQLVDISRGSSIMSMWVEEPVIDATNRTITFAGGIPNGYCGRIAGDPRLTNVVVDLLFQSPGFVIGAGSTTQEALLSFSDDTQVLLNDGLGTRAPLGFLGAKINLWKTASGTINNQWRDIVAADDIYPEEFSIALERTKNAYSNDWFIVFNTTDKQSGIDHYEVIEESMIEANLFNWGREDAPWIKAKSPYVLNDQSLNSTIRVRAIDKAGNEYIATYVPDEAQRTVARETKIMIAIIIVILTLVLFASLIALILFIRKRKKALREELI